MNPNTCWVLLRGLGRESGHWGDFSSLFRSAFSSEEVFFLDLPGTGSQMDQISPYTISEILQELRAQWRKKGESQQVHLNKFKIKLLTLSLGGMIAMEWLSRYPHELHSVVLVNTSVAGLTPFYRRLRPYAFFSLISVLMTQDYLKKEKKILKLVSQHHENRKKVELLWRSLAEERPISLSNLSRQLWAALHYHYPLQMPPVPVLLLASNQDRMVHPINSQMLRKKYDWELKLHPWAGHDIAIDDPEWLMRQIQEWEFSLTSS